MVRLGLSVKIRHWAWDYNFRSNNKTGGFFFLSMQIFLFGLTYSDSSSTETFCDGDVLFRRRYVTGDVLLRRHFVTETFCMETFCRGDVLCGDVLYVRLILPYRII
jgi:hypothetical protein